MEKIYGFVPIAIDEGRTDDFIAGALACNEAVLPDLTGTQAYEWFLSDDGREAYVIEVYDNPEAVAHHSRMMDGKAAKLREFARLQITFAGDVPDALQDRIRVSLGEVGYAGRLAHGRMTEPSPHRIPPAGDELIFAIACFRPHPGKIDELRMLAREAFDRACAVDPGTRGYEWFFDDDGNCLALDIYENPQAMLAHISNCASIMSRILSIVDSRTIILGTLPPEIEARLRPELGIKRLRRRLHGVA